MIIKMNNIKERLTKEKDENNNGIKILKEKLDIINQNSFSYKFSIFAIYAIFGTFIELPFLYFFRSNVSLMEILRNAWLVVPISVGTIMTIKNYKSKKLKEKLKNIFGKKPTYQERIEKKLEYEMAIEKLINDNKILNSSLEKLNNEEKDLIRFLEDYNIESKNINSIETEKDINNLSNNINDLKNKIDLMTIKNILQRNYNIVLDKTIKFCNVFMCIIFSFVALGIIANVPSLYILLSSTIINSSLFSSILYFAPSILCFVMGLGYIHVKNKNYKEVLDKINDGLKENKLSLKDDLNKNFLENYNEELRNVINLKCSMEKKKESIKNANIKEKETFELINDEVLNSDLSKDDIFVLKKSNKKEI